MCINVFDQRNGQQKYFQVLLSSIFNKEKNIFEQGRKSFLALGSGLLPFSDHLKKVFDKSKRLWEMDGKNATF